MPIYTYRCRKCGHQYDVLVMGTSGEPKKCEKCDSKQLERKFGTFGVGGSSAGKSTKSSSCDTTSCSPT